PEGVDHALLAGDLGGDAQLDLAVVGLHQHAAGRGDEAAAVRLAAGQVLQVGPGAGHAAGDGAPLLPAAVDPAVVSDVLQPPGAVGRDPLGGLAVVPQQVGHRVVAAGQGTVLGVRERTPGQLERLPDLSVAVPVPAPAEEVTL